MGITSSINRAASLQKDPEKFNGKDKIDEILGEAGGGRTRRGASRISAEQVKQFKELRERGTSTSEIARLFSMPRSTVRRSLLSPEELEEALARNRKRAREINLLDGGERQRKRNEKRRSTRKKKIKIINDKYLSTERGCLLNIYSKINRRAANAVNRKRTLKGKEEAKKIFAKEDQLTREEFLEAWAKHKRKYGMKCYYTGVEMTFEKREKQENIPDNKLSVDRFRSKIGYTKGNIVFCCFKFNRTKNDMSVEDCQIVVDKDKERAGMCPYCAENCEKTMVHGHYQCTNCGKNVDECCQGEVNEK